jgi:hypothetical protein
MSLTRKSAPPDQGPVDLPDRLPRIPDEVKSRFPSMADWESELDNWWLSVRTALRRSNSDVNTQQQP